MVSAEELLGGSSVLRNIGDKAYDKRKQAALDVEQIVKRLVEKAENQRIRLVIDKLAEYALSPQPNVRKVRRRGRVFAREAIPDAPKGAACPCRIRPA
jgi:vacuole morphology and inheritance protein 14